MSLGRIGTCQHQHVGIRHLLLLVGQQQELLIYMVELALLQFHTVHVQTVLQGSAPTAGCQYDRVVVDAHILRVHNLVGVHILQHTVLMDTTRVGKGVTPYYGLVRLHRHVHQARHHPRRRIDLHRVDVRLDAQLLVTLQYHGYLLERRVTRTLSDAVHGHLHLPGSRHHTAEGVGRSHTQIIVAMR